MSINPTEIQNIMKIVGQKVADKTGKDYTPSEDALDLSVFEGLKKNELEEILSDDDLKDSINKSGDAKKVSDTIFDVLDSSKDGELQGNELESLEKTYEKDENGNSTSPDMSLSSQAFQEFVAQIMQKVLQVINSDNPSYESAYISPQSVNSRGGTVNAPNYGYSDEQLNGTGGSSSDTPQTVNPNAITADGKDWSKCGYDAEKGANLASTAINKCLGTKGYCLRGVSNTISNALGDHSLKGLGSAYQAANALAKDDNFQEVKLDSYNDIHNLPAGSIVVWSQYDRDGDGQVGDSDGGQHGHITMTDGKDNWYSDHHDNYDIVSWYHNKKGATARVFVPV